MKIKLSFLVLFGILLGSIFLFTQIVKSANSDIVINEICSTGCADNNKHQWVEIFNKGSETVDIMGWKFWEEQTNHSLKFNSSSLLQDYLIQPGEYCAIVEDDQTFVLDYPGFASHIFDSSWSTLNKSGEEIGLKLDNNNFADGPFIYPSAALHSLERISAGNLSSDSINWKENPSGNTVGQINYWTSYIPPPPPPAPVNQNPIAVIYGPTSTTVGETVIFDGSDSNDSAGTIMSYAWLVGEEVMNSSSIFSYQFVTSGSFVVGLQVVDDQGASASTSIDVIVNSIVVSTTSSTLPEADLPLAEIFPRLYLNEFLPDPATSSEHEWVEIYNPTTSSVNLGDWTLSDSVTVRNSPTGTVNAGGFFVIELSNILNNTGDTIILKNPLNEISDLVVYGTSTLKAPAKGNSMARSINGMGVWQETTTFTKDLSNIITAPLEVIHETAGGGGGSTAQNNNQINNYQSTGQIIINEVLPNPKGTDTENEFIELKNIGVSGVDLTGWSVGDTVNKYKIKQGYLSAGGFFILKRSLTNISFNNSGEETVKLFNPIDVLIEQIKYTGPVAEDESYARNLDNTWGWTTKLTPGAENVFVNKNLPPVVAVSFPVEVEVGETAVFDASDTYDPENDNLNFIWTIGEEKKNGEILQYVFDRAGERIVNLVVDDGIGNKIEKKFKISVVRNEGENENKIETKTETQNSIKVATVLKKSSKSMPSVITTTLDKIRDLEISDRVKVSGVVAVEPGILGSQYFYIIDPVSEAGVQVYSNKKDFPDLKIGDKIQVTGDLSESYGERRVKIKVKTEIKKISVGNILNPKIVEVSEVGEDTEGGLIQVQGEVTEAKATYLYLDDGTEEIKIALKKGTGLIGTNYLVGEKVQLIGLVGQIKDGYQIMPRSDADIIKIAEAPLLQSASSTTSSANVAETYLTATAGGLTSILVGLFAKARGKVVWNVVKKSGSFALRLFRRNPRV